MAGGAVCSKHGLTARPINVTNERNVLFCFFGFLSAFARFWVFFGIFRFFVFFMSLEPICIVVTHHMWHFPPYLVSLLHICVGDISNLDRFIRSLPRGEDLMRCARGAEIWPHIPSKQPWLLPRVSLRRDSFRRAESLGRSGKTSCKSSARRRCKYSP